MNIGTFFQILRKYIGVNRTDIPDFIAYIFNLVIIPPQSKEDDDIYAPYAKPSEASSANKLFKGQRHILKKYIPVLTSSFSGTNLIDEINDLNPDVIENLVDDFTNEGIDCDSNNIGPTIIDLFKKFIEASEKEKKEILINPNELRTIDGQVLPTIPTSTVYIKNNILYNGNKKPIKLPPQMIPPDIEQDKKMPYLQALIEIYKEIKAFESKKEEIQTLDTKYKKHLDSQRKSFYSAESIRHSLRSVYCDIDDEFQKLIEDAYDGIEVTYQKETYNNGFERLQSVLEKITSTDLNKSTLKNIGGLINNLEKKGLCHMLVNENIIKSWVNINE